MKRLEAMRDAGLPVTWGTVLVGWRGPGKHDRLVDAADVIAHAVDAIAAGDASQPVATLAAVDPAESEEIATTLAVLAQRERSDLQREQRKWRALLLKETLDELPSKPLYALLALTSFWEKFGFPEDGPHVVQGRGNQLSPADYYSQRNYEVLLNAHRAWLQNELAELATTGSTIR